MLSIGRHRPRLWDDHLACVKFNKHGSIRFQVLDRHGQSEVV
jgi:hypothetical protein